MCPVIPEILRLKNMFDIKERNDVPLSVSVSLERARVPWFKNKIYREAKRLKQLESVFSFDRRKIKKVSTVVLHLIKVNPLPNNNSLSGLNIFNLEIKWQI